MYRLRRAIGLIAKRRGAPDPFDIDDDRRFGRIVREIESSIELWPSDARGLLEPDNWRTDRLVNADGTFRKPEADLDVSLTSKDNLILEWFPRDYTGGPLAETDFIRWENHWPLGGEREPFNRIVMIRGFGRLRRRASEPTYGEAEQLLIEAVAEHLEYVQMILEGVCSVRRLNGLFLDHTPEPSTWDAPRRLIEWNIKDIEKENCRREQEAKERWLSERFDKQLGISAQRFLQGFAQASGAFETTAKAIRVSRSVKLSGAQVRTLVVELYRNYPDLYDDHCTFPPRGERPRSRAVVIPLPRR